MYADDQISTVAVGNGLIAAGYAQLLPFNVVSHLPLDGFLHGLRQ